MHWDFSIPRQPMNAPLRRSHCQETKPIAERCRILGAVRLGQLWQASLGSLASRILLQSSRVWSRQKRCRLAFVQKSPDFRWAWTICCWTNLYSSKVSCWQGFRVAAATRESLKRKRENTEELGGLQSDTLSAAPSTLSHEFVAPEDYQQPKRPDPSRHGNFLISIAIALQMSASSTPIFLMICMAANKLCLGLTYQWSLMRIQSPALPPGTMQDPVFNGKRAKEYPFKLDNFQEISIACLVQSLNCICCKLTSHRAAKWADGRSSVSCREALGLLSDDALHSLNFNIKLQVGWNKPDKHDEPMCIHVLQERRESVLVSAHTSAGKTAVAE